MRRRLIAGVCGMIACAVWAADYYVDSVNGDDRRSGTCAAEAWRSLEKVRATRLQGGDRVLFKRGGIWRGSFRSQSGAEGRRLVYTAYGKGPKPIIQNSIACDKEGDWVKIGEGLWKTAGAIPVDAGIFICNHGKNCGVKKWRAEDCTRPLDYWYDSSNKCVVVNYPFNPAKAFDSIELALTQFIVDLTGAENVTFEALTFRYGAAHGFGGGKTKNVTIRNCDLYWIGGGFFRFIKDRDGNRTIPERYGNGIEFGCPAEGHLVERCRLWQIYDAALTCQGFVDPQRNIVWRDNVIWQCVYSYEYWNHNPKTVTENIVFEHNTCIDAGGGWGYDHRPDRNAAHVMFFWHPAATTNFVIRNNVFVDTRLRSTMMWNKWNQLPVIDNNLYWIPEMMLFEMYWNPERKPYKTNDPFNQRQTFRGRTQEDFKRYQETMGLDRNSHLGQVQFVDESKRDYRLVEGSFGSNLASDGGPVGARNMPGLDKDQSVD